MNYAILALLLTTSPAPANNEPTIYGIGVETCQVALTKDWLTNGEVAWVAGFMSAGAVATEKGDIYPGHSTQDLIGLVYKKCKDAPFSSLGDVTLGTMLDLWAAEKAPPKGEKF